MPVGVVGVLLAAGESRRMGRLKPLLPFGGRTVLESCLERFREAEVVPIVVVLGGAAQRIQEMLGSALKASDVQVVVNAAYRLGMLRSIQEGLSAAQRLEAEGVVLALVDQPFVPAEIFRGVAEVLRTGESEVVVPTYRGRRGHPIGLRASVFSEILQLDSRKIGLSHWIRAHPERVLELPVPTETILQDMDLPDEYRNARRRWDATWKESRDDER